MKAVLLVNLGSPDSTSKKDVKKYLGEFLMDQRVIDLPYLSRLLLVKGIIQNTRPAQSAAAYKKIWWKEGSPLIVLSNRLKDKVAKLANKKVYLAMRYGKPSMQSTISQMVKDGVTEVLLFPLYPQFSMPTTETIEVLAKEIKAEFHTDLKIEFFKPFYKNPDYIDVLAKSIKNKLGEELHNTTLLFSYHGVPERHIKNSDITQSHCKLNSECCNTPSIAHQYCYRHQCYETSKLLIEKLNLQPNKYLTTFQSRLGNDPWLSPSTDTTLKQLGHHNTDKLAVITPAFVSDCLETLEEINMEGREDFTHRGGKDFTFIPCLNDQDDWCELISKWINNWN